MQAPVQAALTQCATSWDNFNAPGYVSEYTSQGEVIADEETAADSSNGGAAVQPADADLASASPGVFPGPEATSFFGYYDGGTVYDPDDPSTMEDDYILFRMRVEGDPSQGAAFGSRHWNVLFDVDGDGYKEWFSCRFGGSDLCWRAWPMDAAAIVENAGNSGGERRLGKGCEHVQTWSGVFHNRLENASRFPRAPTGPS